MQKAAQSVNPGTILMGLRIENSPYTFFMMIDEKTKQVCRAEGQNGSYGKLTKDEATDLQEKIRDGYNVRLILDNLPVTTYDLQRGPESVRPGYELGFVADNKYYINNHLIFKILVHPTNGQYTRMKEEMEQLEAAAVVEVCHVHCEGLLSAPLALHVPGTTTTCERCLKAAEHTPSQGAGRKLLVPAKYMTAMRRLLQDSNEATTVEAAAFLDAVDMQTDWLGASHLFMVVGFEVVACSIHRKPGANPEALPCPSENNNVQPQVDDGAP